MTTATIATPKKEKPFLFEGLTWREFKAVEQLLDRSEEIKGLDLDLLLRCINMVNHVDAIKTFQQALQK